MRSHPVISPQWYVDMNLTNEYGNTLVKPTNAYFTDELRSIVTREEFHRYSHHDAVIIDFTATEPWYFNAKTEGENIQLLSERYRLATKEEMEQAENAIKRHIKTHGDTGLLVVS